MSTLVRGRCLTCNYETDDVEALEVWNDWGNHMKVNHFTCKEEFTLWTLSDGSMVITEHAQDNTLVRMYKQE